jgi:hypothetical protein
LIGPSGGRLGVFPGLVLAALVALLAASCGHASRPTAVTTPGTTTQPAPTMPPPTTGGNAPSPSPDPGEVVSRIVAGLPVATVAFNTPTKLRRGETATIKLLLSPGTISVDDLEKRVDEAGEKSGARVKYSSLMEAKLASEDFDVTPLTREQQLVAAGQDTEWLWQITPKHTGVLHLFLTLNAILDVAGQSNAYKVETFNRTLTIKVSLMSHVRDAFKANWQWLWTAVLVPVGLWFYRRRARPAPSEQRE